MSDETVTKAIAYANSILPGAPAVEGYDDPRWQAVIEVENFIETDPQPIWQFVRQWGSCPHEDVRDAIACCLLEHLLEHHFDVIFPRVETAARDDPLFADTFSRCWKLGQAKATGHCEQFDQLKTWCTKRAETPAPKGQ
jgi:hypothetical protein